MKLNRMQRKFVQIMLLNETPATMDKALPHLSRAFHDYISSWVDNRIKHLVSELKKLGYNDDTAREVLTYVCINGNFGFIDKNTSDYQERNLWFRRYPYLAREVQRKIVEGSLIN